MKILPVSRTLERAPGCSLCLGEMTRHGITIATQELWPVVWLSGQGHGKVVTRKLGEEVFLYIYRPLLMGINHEDSCLFVSHMNACHRIISTEKDFNNQVKRMTLSLSLFPQPPLSSPNGLMDKVAVVAGMMVMHGFSNTVFHSLRLT